MKDPEQIKTLYAGYGDELYTAAVNAAGDEENAVPLLIQANERLLDSGRHFGSDRKRYEFVYSQIRKLGRHRSGIRNSYSLSVADEDRIVKAAEIYAKSGGRERDHIEKYIAAGVIFLVLILAAVYALSFCQQQVVG